jgi:ATP-dependent helicase YprA (DUF1998 family)
MNKTIKKLLYRHCESSLKCRLIKYKKRSDELYESLNSETKSSAGDKHETGRAMIQLDREKIGQQVKEIEKEFELFSKINSNVVLNSIGLGSLVITQENQYYILYQLKYLNTTIKLTIVFQEKVQLVQPFLKKKLGMSLLLIIRKLKL